MLFRGRDKVSSLNPVGLPADLKPAENLVWGITAKKSLGKSLVADFEYAFSAYTRDISNQELILKNFSYYNNLGGLYTPNVTSQFNKAYFGNVRYDKEKYQLKVAFRHIDPNYQSMGTPFLNNDLEDLTGGISWRMFKGKLNVAASAGGQRNNLDNTLAARVVRLVSSVALQYSVNSKLNFGANYGNYNTSTNKVQFQQLDSIRYFQVTHNGGFVTNYNFGKEKTKQNLALNSTYQKAYDSESNSSDVLNINTSYGLNYVPIDMSVQTSVNFTHSVFKDLTNSNYGLSLVLSKPVLKKKVNVSGGITRQQSYNNGDALYYITNLTASLRYNFKKKHSVGLSAIALRRKSLTAQYPSFSEQRLNLQYSYRF
jgi:hypothetical protein